MADPYGRLTAQESMYDSIASKTGASSPKNKISLMLLQKLSKQKQSSENKMLREQSYQEKNITDKQLDSSRQREQIARTQYNTVAQAIERVDKGLAIPKTLFKPINLRGGGRGASALAVAMDRYNELF